MTWEPPECETLNEAAMHMHELWLSLLAQGFDRHETSHIVLGKPMCDCAA